MDAVAQLPFEQAHPLQVAPELRALQAKGAVHRVRTRLGDLAWLVTRHAEVLQLLDDNRLAEPIVSRIPRLGRASRRCSADRCATSPPSTLTTHGRAPCCSRTSRQSTCGPCARGSIP